MEKKNLIFHSLIPFYGGALKAIDLVMYWEKEPRRGVVGAGDYSRAASSQTFSLWLCTCRCSQGHEDVLKRETSPKSKRESVSLRVMSKNTINYKEKKTGLEV